MEYTNLREEALKSAVQQDYFNWNVTPSNHESDKGQWTFAEMEEGELKSVLWAEAKQAGIIAADFFLADLLSSPMYWGKTGRTSITSGTAAREPATS